MNSITPHPRFARPLPQGEVIKQVLLAVLTSPLGRGARQRGEGFWCGSEMRVSHD